MLRDVAAITTVGLFTAPLVWWAISSIAPEYALLDSGRLITFDFTPTAANYSVALFEAAGDIFDSRDSLVSSVIVALISCAGTLIAALPAAYALSSLRPRAGRVIVAMLLLQRIIPPIVFVFPLLVAYHAAGLLDTHLGVALAHSALNLPFAVLVMKSFFDEIAPEVGEAAFLDGATRWQSFRMIALPQVKGGIAVTAILAFIFSWTEFLLSLFLTRNLRLVPVQAAILVTSTWGFTAAFTTAALIPAFIFILLVQRHLVRGLTLGLHK